MTTIICDVTKKAIPNAQKDVNFICILDKIVSIPAKEKIEEQVTKAMERKTRFTMKEYWLLYMQITRKLAS